MEPTDWTWSPSPSLSSWSDLSLDSATGSSGPSPSPSSISPGSTASAGTRKLVCTRCRKLKEKCIWNELQQSCVRCAKRGIECSGPLPVTPPSQTHSHTNITNDCAQHRPSTARALTFSPYRTAAGRPRVLGPSSSEASLNSVSRANALRMDLIGLYRNAWPVQLTSLPANSFEDLLNGGKDQVSKTFLAIATALGARSSSHSEIVQKIGPAISTVDDDPAGQLTPGGYAEWGIRRNGACLALGRKATTEALALVAREPSFRTLKLAMAAYALNTTFNGDYRGRRPFLLLAVRTWRKCVVDPNTTPEELGELLNGLGHVLFIRDAFYSICYGSPMEFSPMEGQIICEANPVLPSVAFGFPDCTTYSPPLVFNETLTFDLFFRDHLLTLYKLTPIFGTGPLLNFGASEIATLRQVWAHMDELLAMFEYRLAGLKGAPAEHVVVQHDWHGNWRPLEPKAHATVLLGEAISETNDISIILHTRLRGELAAGRLDATDPATAALLVDARERARRALRAIARAIIHWQPAPRKHATFANIFSYMANLPDWVELALARFGEANGPAAREDEFSVDEVELLVRGLRVGSFSQSALVVPLREMERGLEALRRAEAEAKAVDGTLDFNLDEFLVGLDQHQA